MKRIVLALAAVAAFTAPGLAADMAAKAPMRAAPVAYAPSFTGCYIGGGGGYGLWNQENTVFIDGPPRIQALRTTTEGGRGWFGTVQGGCDYQLSAGGFLGGGGIVLGAFADYDFADLKGDVGPFPGLIGHEKMSSAWAVGGRIGWVALPSLLVYFSGGYTEATFDRTDFSSVAFPIQPGGPFAFIDKRTYKGWFLGAGDEYALSFVPGLFWKTEYRFSEFDVASNPLRVFPGGGLLGDTIDSKKFVHTVRSELVYRFNWSGVGGARY